MQERKHRPNDRLRRAQSLLVTAPLLPSGCPLTEEGTASDALKEAAASSGSRASAVDVHEAISPPDDFRSS